MLMATGFHSYTNKEIFFNDLKNIEKNCELDKKDMKNIYNMLATIRGNHTSIFK